MTNPGPATETPAAPTRWTETVARLVRPGGNTIDVLLEHDVAHVAADRTVVAGVHVVFLVGGKRDDRWGLQKEPEAAREEASRIVTYLTDSSADVWVEPNLGLHNHRDRRWQREPDAGGR